MMDLLKCFEKNWQENIVLPEGTVVLAACSGGIDSLAMLDMLDRLQEVLGVRLAAAPLPVFCRISSMFSD